MKPPGDATVGDIPIFHSIVKKFSFKAPSGKMSWDYSYAYTNNFLLLHLQSHQIFKSVWPKVNREKHQS